MTPDDERRIEQYLRRPDALSEDERRAVEQMIDRDEAARVYAEVVDTFYDLLADEDRREVAPQVEAFVDDLFSDESAPNVVPVRPFRAKQSPRPTVMAAATATSASDRRFSVLTTLAADDEDMLVRVIGDWETEQGRAYVLTDPPTRQAHAVVSFPEFGLDLVTDAKGRLAFDLPSGIDPEQWKQATAVVRRPVASGSLPTEDTLILDREKEATVRCHRTDGTLAVSVQAAEEEAVPSLLTVERPGAKAENRVLVRLPQSESIRHDFPTDEDLMIRLYA